jgi:hypothetical protein
VVSSWFPPPKSWGGVGYKREGWEDVVGTGIRNRQAIRIHAIQEDWYARLLCTLLLWLNGNTQQNVLMSPLQAMPVNNAFVSIIII